MLSKSRRNLNCTLVKEKLLSELISILVKPGIGVKNCQERTSGMMISIKESK